MLINVIDLLHVMSIEIRKAACHNYVNNNIILAKGVIEGTRGGAD